MMTLRKLFHQLFHAALYIILLGFLITGLLRVGMLIYSGTKTYLPGDVPSAPAALVLGAGLNRDGTPGVVLQDRVRTASDLYFSGKVQKI